MFTRLIQFDKIITLNIDDCGRLLVTCLFYSTTDISWYLQFKYVNACVLIE